MLHNRGKSRLVVHRQIRQNATIQGDVSLFQAVDQTAVAQAIGTRLGVDAGDPQAPEVTLLQLPADVGVLEGAEPLLQALAPAALPRPTTSPVAVARSARVPVPPASRPMKYVDIR